MEVHGLEKLEVSLEDTLTSVRLLLICKMGTSFGAERTRVLVLKHQQR